MKKLKIGLIFAFSAALTLGLTACAGEDEYTIDRIAFSGGDTITLTDAATRTEDAGVEAFNAAVADKTLRIYADQSRNYISAADCDFDTSGIVWGSVGTYSVTVTPKENNANGVTAQLTVVIDHDFVETEGGLAVCAACGRSESTTTFASPVVLNYGGFHTGYSEQSTTDPDGLLKPFGTVPSSEGNIEVPTYSAGNL